MRIKNSIISYSIAFECNKINLKRKIEHEKKKGVKNNFYKNVPYVGLMHHQVVNAIKYNRKSEFAKWTSLIQSYPLVNCSENHLRLFLQFNLDINVNNNNVAKFLKNKVIKILIFLIYYFYYFSLHNNHFIKIITFTCYKYYSYFNNILLYFYMQLKFCSK